MSNIIWDEMIEQVEILSKLELSLEDKDKTKKDMEQLLGFVNQLKELEIRDVEPVSHIFPLYNVFREDIITNGEDKENMLANAPEKKNGSFVVPKTVE